MHCSTERGESGRLKVETGATLRDVSFRTSGRKYRIASHVAFAGACLGALTHAGLNGSGAELANVTVE